MTGNKRTRRRSDYDYALTIANEQQRMALSRSDRLDRKIGFCLSFFTVLISIIIFMFTYLFSKIDLLPLFRFTDEAWFAIELRVFCVAVVLSLMTYMGYLVYAIARGVMRLLRPRNMMHPDDEAIRIAVHQNGQAARRTYLADLERSLAYNEQRINAEYTVLQVINGHLGRLVVVYFLTLAWLLATLVMRALTVI